MTTGSVESIAIESLTDLDRYPLADLSSDRGNQVVGLAQARLREAGYAELPGFLNPEGVGALVADAVQLTPKAYASSGVGTAYLGLPKFELPEDHPRRWLGRYSLRAVAYDVMPRTSALRRLYEWDRLTAFIAAILGRGPVYRYADPFGALNLAVMGEGDELQWHFDQTDFVVSLAIQAAEVGGDFEVAPLVRSAADENYDGVATVLSGGGSARAGGGRGAVRTVAMSPGTLLIFEGRNSLHRVSPISGSRLRHVGLLAYDTKPGTMGSDLLRMSRYGRTEAFAEPPIEWPPNGLFEKVDR